MSRALPDLSACLDRQQRRRDSALPAVSVLVGPVDIGLNVARRWAEGRGRRVVRVEDSGLDAIIDAWAVGLVDGPELVRDAVGSLARALGVRADDLGPRIARMSPMERDLLFESVATDQSPAVSESLAACRWILGQKLDGGRIVFPGWLTQLGESIDGGQDGGCARVRAMVTLGGLVASGSGPVVIASRPFGNSGAATWVESVARSLARLAMLQPSLALVLVIEPDDFDVYRRTIPESREKALIRSGMIPVPHPVVARGVNRSPAPPSRPVVSEQDEQARSVAERTLFERLEAIPATAGLFALNATLDIPFGPGATMEVDLFSHALGLAIEIDGYYHFQTEDGYRRDRRKDFLLQGHNYLVVRVLAVDVVSRLEDVLNLVLKAVALRRNDPVASNRETLS